MRIYTLLFFLLLLSSSFNLTAQCVLFEIPIDERISQSVHIVEGKVISQRCFWDDDRHNIHTANKIKISKSFKGLLLTDEVEILTRGGAVDMEIQKDYPSLQLKKGEVGIFFLINNRENISASLTGLPVFQPTAGPQGFIMYDKDTGKAFDPFNTYDDISIDIYNVIEEVVQEKHKITNDFKLKQFFNIPDPSRMVAVTSFTPTTVNAGTDDVITITGSGFGNDPPGGVVEFSNADNGSGSISVATLEDEICSWTDTEIKVQVPSSACTGNFEVIPDGGSAMTSPSALTVTYNQLNVDWPQPTPTNTYWTQHINDDGSGGYTWQRYTDFAASDAAAPFSRSAKTWCDNTNIYWSIGADTNIDVAASDGVNIVRFDNGGELPGGVLGRCTSRWSGCGTGGSKDCETGVGTPAFQWYVTELDIVFDDGTTWYYGSDPNMIPFSSFDFETVSVHELGHGHQLGHFCPAGGVMYFGIGNGSTNRTPNTNEISGASNVYSRSTTSAVCSRPLMSTSVTCAALLLPVELISFQVQKQNRSVELTWSTATEINNDYFVLERSVEGRPFAEIGKVKGAGFSYENTDYIFMDTNPGSGHNYYRLKQVDYDGSFEYSDVRSVHFEINGEDISIYPNPLDGSELTISFASPTEWDLEIEMMDAKGKSLINLSQTLDKGVNNITLNLEDYESGIYYLRFNYGPNTHVERLVKM